MKSQIESLLFIAAKPLTVRQISLALNSEAQQVQAILDDLMIEYAQKGIRIIKVEHTNTLSYQMVTSPEHSELIKAFTHQEINAELTKPALETLTIIAYKGPITKPELEKIRGVNCSMILRNLMIRDLVEEQNDKEKGEYSYMVTPQFIQWLGISDVSALPNYEGLRADEQLASILETNTNET